VQHLDIVYPWTGCVTLKMIAQMDQMRLTVVSLLFVCQLHQMHEIQRLQAIVIDDTIGVN